MNTCAFSNRSRRTTVTFVAIAAVLSAMAVSCGFGPSSAEKIAEQFTTALNARAVPTAAGLTTDAPEADKTLTSIFDSLGPDSHFEVIDVDDDAKPPTITIGARWKLGQDPAKVDWNYETKARAVDTENGWKLTWDPSTIVPQLAEGGSVAFSRVYPEPAAVLDRSDKPILTEQIVTRVVLRPGTDVKAVAAQLLSVDPDITTDSLDSDLTAAKGKPVTAVVLRASDLAPMKKSLEAIDGVRLQPESKLLFADRALASPALNGLTDAWTTQRDAAAGWTVGVADAAGTEHSIAGAPAKPVKDIHTTLDLTIHRAAEAALASEPKAAAIVAFKPSTGGIVAIAQNDAADTIGPIALTGLYPPGSTFKS